MTETLGDLEALPASWWRFFLSVYLDLIFFIMFWSAIEFLAFSQFNFPLAASVVLFVVARAIIGRRFSTPGSFLLSIGNDSFVSPDIKQTESWMTMLIGVIFILQGTKDIVRWTEALSVEPMFGLLLSEGVFVAVSVTYGVAFIALGSAILRLKFIGLIGGLTMIAIQLTSAFMSYALWDEFIEEATIARRELQGVPVGEGEVQAMQAMFPEIVFLVGLLVALALVASWKRFNR